MKSIGIQLFFLYLQCVFHGIRLLRLILKIGCRVTINFFSQLTELFVIYTFSSCLYPKKGACEGSLLLFFQCVCLPLRVRVCLPLHVPTISDTYLPVARCSSASSGHAPCRVWFLVAACRAVWPCFSSCPDSCRAQSQYALCSGGTGCRP